MYVSEFMGLSPPDCQKSINMSDVVVDIGANGALKFAHGDWVDQSWN